MVASAEVYVPEYLRFTNFLQFSLIWPIYRRVLLILLPKNVDFLSETLRYVVRYILKF